MKPSTALPPAAPARLALRAVQLVSAASHLTKGVQIKAPETNSGVVYVGASGVTADSADATDGFPLSPGEGLFVPVDDPSKLYVIASAAGQKVFWFAI